MPQVCSWSDVLLRYGELDKLPNPSSSATFHAEIINMAEGYIHSRLASQFTTPFSNNNITAKDLIVDAVYIQNNLTRQPDKTKLLKDYLEERIGSLLSGVSGMLNSSGTSVATIIGDTIWSSTENYSPIFGMSDIECAIVNSQQLYDEAVSRGEYL